MKNIKGFKVLALVMVIIVSLISFSGCSSSNSSVGSKSSNNSSENITLLKEYELYSSSMPGITLGKVINRFVSSPTWNERTSGNTSYVTISGSIKDIANTFSMTISITDDPTDPDYVILDCDSIKLDGKSLTSEEIDYFSFNIFCACYDGYSDFSKWLNDYALDEQPDDSPSGPEKEFEWVEEPKITKNMYGNRLIVGVIKNVSGSSKTVTIEFACYDSSGYQVGTAIDRVTSLGNGKSWKFEAGYVDDSVVSFELSDITAY